MNFLTSLPNSNRYFVSLCSFHVGSGCTDPETFVQAISDARCVFDMGVSLVLLSLELLLNCCGKTESNVKPLQGLKLAELLISCCWNF